MKRWSTVCAVVMFFLVGSVVALPAPAAAWVAFAKMTTAAGNIDGGVTQKGFEGQISVLGLGNRLRQPLDSASGLPAGKAQLGPLEVVKGFDIATPKLIAAVTTATSFTKVEITIFKTTPTGTSVPGFRITLTNATLFNVDTSYDPGADPSAIEKLEFVYQKMTWTDLITGATGGTP